jgi:hypothetical protein
MRFDVSHKVSDDGLSRELWVFDGRPDGLVLMAVHEQTRQSRRHKFKGPFWDVMDERSYHSALVRPTTIPQSVMDEARLKWTEIIGQIPIYIGWTQEGNRVHG